MKRIAALLLSLLICISMIAYTEGNDAVVVDIMEQFDILGVSIERDKIEQALKEYSFDFCKTNGELSAALLVRLGEGHYNYDTYEWSPLTDQLYAFDLEIFDISHMYTLFLQGVQSIVPDIEITGIEEDLSGLNNDLDGKRKVSFLCNGHPYSFTLVGMHDWFDVNMLDYMQQVIQAENCPYELHYFFTIGQDVALYYGMKEKADRIEAFCNQ